MSTAMLPVAVIGGGSAGISAVAALARSRPVLWYDVPPEPSQRHTPFSVGALASYRSVPANTKVDKLKLVFGHSILAPWIASSPEADAAMQDLLETTEPLPELESWDPSPDGWTGLDSCCGVFQALSDSLAASANVTCVPHRVTAVDLQSERGEWTLRTEAAFSPRSACAVVLATGGSPRSAPLPDHPATELPVNVALSPERLTAALQIAPIDTTVAVLGNSHSALVIVDHCRSLGVATVKLIGKRPLRHAEWIADKADYRYTMAGLKGRGSFVGRLVDGSLPPSGASGGLGATEVQALNGLGERELQAALSDCTHLVQAVGFEGAPLPSLSVDGIGPVPWSPATLRRDLHTSQLQLLQPPPDASTSDSDVGASSSSQPLPLLSHVYGLGLCFPEDRGYCATSPDETPTGFSFANNCALRLAADLEDKMPYPGDAAATASL